MTLPLSYSTDYNQIRFHPHLRGITEKCNSLENSLGFVHYDTHISLKKWECEIGEEKADISRSSTDELYQTESRWRSSKYHNQLGAIDMCVCVCVSVSVCIILILNSHICVVCNTNFFSRVYNLGNQAPLFNHSWITFSIRINFYFSHLTELLFLTR